MKERKMRMCVLSLIALLLFYVICGGIYKEMHPNNSLATILLGLGFTMILVALLFKAQWSAVFTAGGYLISFIVGAVFQRDFVTPSGDTVNDLWAIWLWTYLGCILAGIFLELFLLLRRKLVK